MAIKKQKSSRDSHTLDGNKLARELIGLFSIFFGLLLILSISTFDIRDPSLNHVVSNPVSVHNKAGLFGSYVGGGLLDLLGYASFVVPGYFCLLGARRILSSPPWPWWRWVGVFCLVGVVAFLGASSDVDTLNTATLTGAGKISSHSGGLFGRFLYDTAESALSPTGAWLVWTLLLLLGIQMLVGFSWVVVFAGFAAVFMKACHKMLLDVLEERRKKNRIITLSESSDTLPYNDKEDEAANATPDKKVPFFRLPHKADSTQVLEIKDFSPNSASIDSMSVTLRDASDEASVGKADPMDELLARAEQDRMGKSSLLQSAETLPAYTSNEEEFLPPWVTDFEEDKLGVQPTGHAVVLGTSDPLGSSQIKPFELLQDSTGHTDSNTTHPKLVETGLAVDTPPKDFDLISEVSAKVDPTLLPAVEEELSHPDIAEVSDEEIVIRSEALDSVVSTVQATDVAPTRTKTRVVLPQIDLIEAISPNAAKTTYEELEVKGKALMTCLTDFNIQGELVGITPGPVVTMFEVRPAPGIRVSRIANLTDDLALALKAVAVRIQAPVPGTDTVGIEIPNSTRETVGLRELLASDTFKKSKSLLTLALGKDIAGNPAVADLAAMPHLLVAGATGAGKSVGINSIILSFLFKAKPDEVRLLLVDPKRVEMAIYADLPHLVHPVVTDMQLAKNALDWAVKEMEQRYSDIARAGVRNIGDYNAKLKELGNKLPPGMEGLQFMPYLVIIIDELADLMLVAAKEVETSIVRLAQLARAAGIHLILATQRPSVDVVTGIIKANFPCRMAFQVTSKHDSRTILDTVGAENLLGKGDMLFKPSGGRFQRMHGAFVSDKNVSAVVDFWKSQQKPTYGIDFSEWGTSANDDAGGGGAAGDIISDPLYNETIEFVRQQGKASISLIQRRFRIGFNKAARFVEQMEQDGIIGPADGSKPRQVLR